MGLVLRHVRRWTTVLVIAASLPTPAVAHPHVWIDLAMQVLFDSSGRVTGLRETWLLDEFYTAYATRGIDVADPDKLRALLDVNMKNLADVAYFTKVTVGETAISPGKIMEASSRMRDKRLELTFVLPFVEPADVTAAPLVYAIYDPTYFIEILHEEGGNAIRLINSPRGCRYRLIPPHPSMESVALAAALDTTQTASYELGELFAEKVSVRCGA